MGVHDRRFAGRNAEEAGIEGGNVAQRASRQGVGGARVGLVRGEKRIAGPAGRVDLRDEVVPFQQILPKSCGSGAGKTKRSPNYCNFFTHDFLHLFIFSTVPPSLRAMGASNTLMGPT
ncbi:hypothetical protein D3C79_929540 [compost metagenome]